MNLYYGYVLFCLMVVFLLYSIRSK